MVVEGVRPQGRPTLRYMDTIRRHKIECADGRQHSRPQELEIGSVQGDPLTWKSLQGEKNDRGPLQSFQEAVPRRQNTSFMVHYPDIVIQVGPIVNGTWCMIYEAKHAIGKTLASVVCNVKDICYTIAERHQIRQFISGSQRVPQ